jgi:chromosome segregation ATPase
MQQLSQEMAKMQMAVKKSKEHAADLRSRIAQQEKESSLTAAEQKQLLAHTNALQKLEAQLQAMAENGEVKALRSEAASLQRQMVGVGGPALSKAQSKVDSYGHQIESLSSSLVTKRVEESNCRKQLLKATATREKAEADLLKAQEKLASLEMERKEMSTDADVVIRAVDSAQKKLKDLEASLKTISKEYQDLKDDHAKIIEAEQAIASELERAQKEVREGRAEAKKWHEKAEEVRKEYNKESVELNHLMKTAAEAALQANGRPGEDAVPQPQGASTALASLCGEEGLRLFEVNELPILTEEELSACSKDDLKRDLSAAEAERDK